MDTKLVNSQVLGYTTYPNRLPITDGRYLLMSAKIKPMHLYENRLANSEIRNYAVMHDDCAVKYEQDNMLTLVRGNTIDNARASCTLCNTEYNPTLAEKERKAIKALVSETHARWKALKTTSIKPAAKK